MEHVKLFMIFLIAVAGIIAVYLLLFEIREGVQISRRGVGEGQLLNGIQSQQKAYPHFPESFKVIDHNTEA